MAILINEKKRVLVQGITGAKAGAHATDARLRNERRRWRNPGKGSQSVLGVPVFNTPQEAVDR